MIENTETDWTILSPTFARDDMSELFVKLAKKLSRLPLGGSLPERSEMVRKAISVSKSSRARKDKQKFVAAAHVLADLAAQGWEFRFRRGEVQVQPVLTPLEDRVAEKARLRSQELVPRDAQLSEPSVRTFVRSMEQNRLFKGTFVSIFSLIRDGRDLAKRLREARGLDSADPLGALKKVVDPYLEFAPANTCCEHTGLKLMDIWRYFRHTWSTPHQTTPGRRMMFLVRDRSAEFHPIMGIGSISSPVIQLSERDRWIGWDLDSVLDEIRDRPTVAIAKWLEQTLSTAVSEIYVDDFLEDGILSSNLIRYPNDKVISRLVLEGKHQRQRHQRFSRSKDYKKPRGATPADVHWVSRARTSLFRSKRALALAEYLQAREVLSREFGDRPTRAKLTKLVSTGVGRDTIRRILKKAKSDRVGVGVADLSVCGAVAPYGPLLGGKLVAMLAASPEVVAEYRRRYSAAESEIASAMAGRPIIRPPHLVLLSTSSLYGIGSSQYNRIKIPCGRIGGERVEEIRYEKLGYSEAHGTSQYSTGTVEALTLLVEQEENGKRVNSIFGEGVSPRMRKVRTGLDVLGFPSRTLLRHYRQRIVYAVPLARNFRDYLLGRCVRPAYFIPLRKPVSSSGAIADWWRGRWLQNRIRSDAVLKAVSLHSIARPIRHGARVELPVVAGEDVFFTDDRAR